MPPTAADELPDVHAGYAAFLKAFGDSRQDGLRRLLAVYDAHLAANPGDVAVAIDRCQFLIEATEFGDNDEDCLATLAERFPASPAVLQFQIDHKWREQAIDFGNAVRQRTDIRWFQAEAALFLRSLAFAQMDVGRLDDALKTARAARNADPTVDIGFVFAKAFQRDGHKKDAIAELAHNEPSEDRAFASLSLLVELGGFREALPLIEALERKGVKGLRLLHARSLLGVGRADEARAKYKQLGAELWNRKEVSRALFYLDVAGTDQSKAIAGYEALRDQGWESDPLLRHRFALLAAFPTAPWHARDLWGLAALLGVLLSCLMAPAILVLPLHYVSLVRGPRAGASTPAGERWSFKNLWLLMAATLVLQAAAYYVWAYDELMDWGQSSLAASTASEKDIAHAFLTSIICSCILYAAALRRGDYDALVRTRWSTSRITLVVFASFLLIQGFQVLVRAIASALELDLPTVALGTSTRESIRAVLHTHGPVTMLLLIVVVGPVYEELAFRSVLLGVAERSLPFRWANTLQAACFALMHDEPSYYPVIFALGFAAGSMVRRSGGLAPALALHATFNLFAGAAIWYLDARPSPHAEAHGIVKRVVPDAAELRRRCDANDMLACVDAASGLLASHTASDATKAFELYSKACAADHALGCYGLSQLYSEGNGVPQSFTKAVEPARKACERNISSACNLLGTFYETSRGIPEDPAEAVRLYRRACDGGEPWGCTNLGRTLAYGYGVEAAPAEAARLYRVGCEHGVARACGYLARNQDLGEGVARDRAAATRSLITGCDLADAESCSALALRYRYGAGVDIDLAKAETTRARACELGARKACNSAQH